MIKRENFVALMEGLIYQEQREEAFCKMLERYFDGHIISEISGKLMDIILDVLADEVDHAKADYPYGSMIEWWLFDAPDHGRNKNSAFIYLDDKRYPLENAGQLYDYLVEVAK